MTIVNDSITKLIAGAVPVSIYLSNGVSLKGTITETCNDGFLLTRDNVTQLVLFHALATVLPQS